LIRQAQRSVSIQTFIWTNDECGRLLIYELIEAARRGDAQADRQQQHVAIRHHRRAHRVVGVVAVRHRHRGVGLRRSRQHLRDRREVDNVVFDAGARGDGARAVDLAAVPLPDRRVSSSASSASAPVMGASQAAAARVRASQVRRMGPPSVACRRLGIRRTVACVYAGGEVV
jgi:hypothetical protein